jgi:hypothetical protein
LRWNRLHLLHQPLQLALPLRLVHYYLLDLKDQQARYFLSDQRAPVGSM